MAYFQGFLNVSELTWYPIESLHHGNKVKIWEKWLRYVWSEIWPCMSQKNYLPPTYNIILYTLLSAIFLHICSSCRRRPPLTHVKILTESQSIISLHCSAGRPDRPRYLRVHRAKEGRGMGQVLPLLKRELVLPFNTLIPLFAYHHLATLVSWRVLIWANSNPDKMGKISW